VPAVTVDEIVTAQPDVVLLPVEPYRFTVDDGTEVFPHLRCVLIDGRGLTWYGPSLATARKDLTRALTAPPDEA
jgi:hypothetical protein